jgi:hypothetical protein
MPEAGRYLLTALPAASFAAQLLFSISAGTLAAMTHHTVVMIVDWLFIPFNWFAVHAIDWRKGDRIYSIVSLSLLLNVVAHAYWQQHGLDPGHLITSGGVTLPAGWAHLVFATLQATILIAFVFCRDPTAESMRAATSFSTLYFIALPVASYEMHSGIELSGVLVCCLGLFFTLVFPRLSCHAPS